MNKLCWTILLLMSRVCYGQNFVNNGDFEQYTSCPSGSGQIDLALFWTNSSLYGTPDYYNQCSTQPWVGVPSNNGGGYQFAHSGDAYAGIFLMQLPYLDAREYLQVELSSSLISEVLYHFEMYVNLCNLSSFAIEDVGIYFSDTNDFQPFSVMPQIINSSGFISDTLNWTLISGDYIANGGETYLTIGNFKNDSNTDTTFIGQNSSQLLSYIYVDDVSLTSSTGISNNSENVLINIFPNPIINEIQISINNNSPYEIFLYDITSRKIMQNNFVSSVSLNIEQLAKGIYIYELWNKNEVIRKGKIVKE
jgi:hypothetical protein